MSMDGDQGKDPFWTAVPGGLQGLAAVIFALTALVGAVTTFVTTDFFQDLFDGDGPDAMLVYYEDLAEDLDAFWLTMEDLGAELVEDLDATGSVVAQDEIFQNQLLEIVNVAQAFEDEVRSLDAPTAIEQGHETFVAAAERMADTLIEIENRATHHAGVRSVLHWVG